MQFTTLFVSAATIAVVLASPVDVVKRGGSSGGTSGDCSGNTQTNAVCCSKINSPTSGGFDLVSLLSHFGVLATGEGCSSLADNQNCNNEIICCNSPQENDHVLIGINLGCAKIA